MPAAQLTAGAYPIQGGPIPKITSGDRTRRYPTFWSILNCGEGAMDGLFGTNCLSGAALQLPNVTMEPSTRELRDSRTRPVRDEPASTEDIKVSSLHGVFSSSPHTLHLTYPPIHSIFTYLYDEGE